MTSPDILYIHGFEGSLHGTKGSWLQERYHTVGPIMTEASFSKLGLDPSINHDVTDLFPHIQKRLAPSYEQAIAQIDLHNLPKVVIASSFGAAIWLKMVQEYNLRTPTILLAPACIELGQGDAFPADMHIIIIHGNKDEVISPSSAKKLQQNSGTQTQLWMIEDEHRLKSLTTGNSSLQKAIAQLLELSH